MSVYCGTLSADINKCVSVCLSDLQGFVMDSVQTSHTESRVTALYSLIQFLQSRLPALLGIDLSESFRMFGCRCPVNLRRLLLVIMVLSNPCAHLNCV